MQPNELTKIFDQQAQSYDEKWSRIAPINGALHLLGSAVLAALSPTAHVLCVGAGTGSEILSFAQRFPEWRFTAVEPSAAMLAVFRSRAEAEGIASRCTFHGGFLDQLPQGEAFDAATAFLVSQFILDREDRVKFFQSIAARLCAGGILASSDLAGDVTSTGWRTLLEVWFQLMKGGGIPAQDIDRMREAYTRDVAVLPASEVCDIIQAGGFETPVQFFQAGLIHAWYTRRSPA